MTLEEFKKAVSELADRLGKLPPQEVAVALLASENDLMVAEARIADLEGQLQWAENRLEELEYERRDARLAPAPDWTPDWTVRVGLESEREA